MITITAAFSRLVDAEAAIDALHAAGFTMKDEVSHPLSAAELEASGEPNSPGAEGAGRGAARGAIAGSALGAIVGLGTTPFVGPAGVLGGMGVGAYTGSLLGALGGIESEHSGFGEEDREIPSADPEPRFVTVAAASPAGRERAVDILQAHGATRIVDHE